MDYWLKPRLFQLQGTMGGYTWCRNGVVRRARRSDKAHFHSAPSLQRTRENATEFGRASRAARLLRQIVGSDLEGLQTLAFCSRLTSRMRQVLGRDAVHGHGARRVLSDNLPHLEGFEMNPEARAARFALPAITVCRPVPGFLQLRVSAGDRAGWGQVRARPTHSCS